jgi:hypothetical protein
VTDLVIGHERLRGRLPSLLGVALVVLTLTACSGQGFRGLTLDNRSGVVVDVTFVAPTGAEVVVLRQFDTGKVTSIGGFPGTTDAGDPCTVLTLIARDQQHREVARHEGKICLDDRWIIVRSEQSPAPPSSARSTPRFELA